MPRVWFLFGLSGSGKSYAGDVLASHYHWPVYHADEDITPAMRDALANARPFTDAMRDEFFVTLVDRIRQKLASTPPAIPLIVTQGAYKRHHRCWLQAQLPGTRFVWVQADRNVIEQRLRGREDGISVESAAALTADFEMPDPLTPVLDNNGDAESLVRQFEVFFRG